MKRRIIKQGHNTLTITLPSKWAGRFNVRAGDEVELIEQGKDLMIVTEKTTSGSERVVIDISGLIVPMIWRLISSAYRAGYDEIKIVFENKGFKDMYTAFTYNTIYTRDEEIGLSQLEAIQALVNRFIGFEIIEQKTNYCIIKDLGSTSMKEFENTLRRIFLLIQTMADGIDAALKGERDDLKAFHIIDTNLDRFQDFCLRVLNKHGYTDFRKTPTIYSLIFILELIGDEYKKLGVHLFNVLKKKSVSNHCALFINHVRRMIDLYYDLYYKFTTQKAEMIYKLDDQGYKLYEKILPHLSLEEKEIVHHLKKIGKYMTSATELRIDLAY